MMNAGTFGNFEEASRSVLDFLHRRYGFGLWMVTRVQGEDWIILQAEDHHYGVGDGTVLKWADSFCSRMSRGEGPRIAPRSRDIAAYTEAAINESLSIGAYVGVPLRHPDGRLFGTMCAIDPAEQPQVSEADLPLIELLARLLSTILAHDIDSAQSREEISKARSESLSDPLTGLPNRRAWDRMIEREQGNLQQFGGVALITIIDLDNLKDVNDSRGHAAGDELLRRCAEALADSVRDSDFVARLGGDEFGVASIDYKCADTARLDERLREVLVEGGVIASVGSAAWNPGGSLQSAWRQADRAMYADKHCRRGQQ